MTERTDSHLENLRVGLALWEGLLQLGRDVESWATNQLAAFAQSHPFQSDEEVAAMQVKMLFPLVTFSPYPKKPLLSRHLVKDYIGISKTVTIPPSLLAIEAGNTIMLKQQSSFQSQ